MPVPIPDEPLRQTVPEAFERLFREHYDRVFRTAFRITGNAMDAEDVLQTVFLRLIRRDEGPDLREGAAGYFHQAAINAALDVVRRRSRQVPLDEARWQAQPDPHPGPDAHAQTRELHAGLRTAVAHLPPKAAQIFVLRFLEGLSNPEIARRLGTSQATVAVLLYRARRRLQKEIHSLLGGVP